VFETLSSCDVQRHFTKTIIYSLLLYCDTELLNNPGNYVKVCAISDSNV